MPIMINNGCTVPIIVAQYYQQNKHVTPKCKHLKIPPFMIVRMDNGQIIPLGLVLVPFKFYGIK